MGNPNDSTSLLNVTSSTMINNLIFSKLDKLKMGTSTTYVKGNLHLEEKYVGDPIYNNDCHFQ